MKRTYNLSSETVAAVKRLVEERGAASSQDAFVERAIRELIRQLQDLEDARLWRRAARDEQLQGELKHIETEFRNEDYNAWQQ